MEKRPLLTACLVSLVLIGLVAFLSRYDAEPRYYGKPLSYWLQEGSQKSDEAVRAIGTKAVPHLLRWIAYEPPAWRKRLAAIGRKYSDSPMFVLRAPTNEHKMAIIGFSILRTNALPAMPTLARLMNETNQPRTAINATLAVGYLGPQALPCLSRALSSTHYQQRIAAVSAIAQICSYGAPADAFLPLLLTAAADPVSYVREFATNTIRTHAPQALTNSRSR